MPPSRHRCQPPPPGTRPPRRVSPADRPASSSRNPDRAARPPPRGPATRPASACRDRECRPLRHGRRCRPAASPGASRRPGNAPDRPGRERRVWQSARAAQADPPAWSRFECRDAPPARLPREPAPRWNRTSPRRRRRSRRATDSAAPPRARPGAVPGRRMPACVVPRVPPRRAGTSPIARGPAAPDCGIPRPARPRVRRCSPTHSRNCARRRSR